MPRRLGDDPLARAKNERARSAEGPAPVALGSGGQQGTAQVRIQSSSRASYNDVFFQRRGEALTHEQVSAEVRDAPEISEISEIPEIRDAAASSGSEPAMEVVAEAEPAFAAVQGAEVAQAPPVSIIEEVVAKLNALPTAPSAGEVAHVKAEPASPTSPQAPSNGGEAPPEPQRGGFFKRLFGKFK